MEPQNSGDPRRVCRWLGCQCRLCGHRVARVIASGTFAADLDALSLSAPIWPLLTSAQGPGGTASTLRLARAPFSGWPTARGWGCAGQGLCVLHEPPHLMEYLRPLPSGPRPSCSTRKAPPKRPRHPPAGWVSADNQTRSVRRTCVFRCHDI